MVIARCILDRISPTQMCQTRSCQTSQYRCQTVDGQKQISKDYISRTDQQKWALSSHPQIRVDQSTAQQPRHSFDRGQGQRVWHRDAQHVTPRAAHVKPRDVVVCTHGPSQGNHLTGDNGLMCSTRAAIFRPLCSPACEWSTFHRTLSLRNMYAVERRCMCTVGHVYYRILHCYGFIRSL